MNTVEVNVFYKFYLSAGNPVHLSVTIPVSCCPKALKLMHSSINNRSCFITSKLTEGKHYQGCFNII